MYLSPNLQYHQSNIQTIVHIPMEIYQQEHALKPNQPQLSACIQTKQGHSIRERHQNVDEIMPVITSTAHQSVFNFTNGRLSGYNWFVTEECKR